MKLLWLFVNSDLIYDYAWIDTEDDYLFELGKIQLFPCTEGSCNSAKKIDWWFSEKKKITDFDYEGMIVRRTVLIEIAQGKTLMLYSLFVLQQNVSLSLNLVMPLGTTSSFWFNFKLIEFKVFFSTSSTSSFHWSNHSKISNYLLKSVVSEWVNFAILPF